MSKPKTLRERVLSNAEDNIDDGDTVEERLVAVISAICEEVERELFIDEQTDEARDQGQDMERQSLKQRVLMLEAKVANLERM